ncbi:MAG: bacteriohemerythrin [Bacillota bacterium]
MAFEWKEQYTVNVKEIDEQHKKLFEIGSRLYALTLDADDTDHYDEIIDILEELKDYTMEHFRFEENLLLKHNYKYLDKHKVEHDAFIDKLGELESQNIDEKQKRVKMELIMFVSDWIGKHILKTDSLYKAHFNNMGVF